jgi:hypothetical protein
MRRRTLFLLALFFALTLVACGPDVVLRSTQKIWIDAPLDGASLTEGTHDVIVHATYSGEIGWFEIGLSFPGYAYGKAAVPPGEPLDETDIANFEWVTDGLAIAVVPFPFVAYGESNEATLGACIIAPGGAEIDCTFITVYLPQCEPGEVSLGPDCIPAALEDTPVATVIPNDLVAIPSQNANCRQGPSASLFEIDDTLFEDKEYQPIGVGPDGQWLQFLGPVSDSRCWVFSDNLDLFCRDVPVDVANLSPCTLPVVPYPALPTLTPTPTFTPEPDRTGTPAPQCSDGIDNDGDGDIDLADGRCLSPTDDDENS